MKIDINIFIILKLFDKKNPAKTIFDLSNFLFKTQSLFYYAYINTKISLNSLQHFTSKLLFLLKISEKNFHGKYTM